MTKGARRPTPLVAVLILVAIALLVTACGSSSNNTTSESSSSESGKPITVGAAIGFTGYDSFVENPPWNAFKLAAEKVNAEGGINGRKIKWVTRDMRSETAQGAPTVSAVIGEGAELVLTPCDPDLSAPGDVVAQEHGILTFSLCEASTRAVGPQAVGELVYTPSHAAQLEGQVMAEWGTQKKNVKTAYIVRDTEGTYNLDVCKGFENRFPELGGKILGTDNVKQEDTSIPSTITNIKNANPDAIFICSFPPGASSWTRQIRAAGLNQPILSDMSMDGEYWLKAVPDLSEFFYPAAVSIYGDDPNPKVNAFVKEYAQKYGEAPETAYALFGVAILELWQNAVEEAGTTEGEAVSKKLNMYKKFPTVVGATTYTEEEHIALKDRPMLIMQIQHGKPSYVETWQPEKPIPLTEE